MAQIRTFISINLPEEVRAHLEKLETDLKKSFPSISAKWVDVSSLHLTLKFLGSIEENKIDSVTVALAKGAEQTTPFSLGMGGLGAFPNMRRVDVVVVGLSGELDCLLQLQNNIEEAMKPLGFRPESRPFAPHLTLARLREQSTIQERQAMGQALQSAQLPPMGPFKVTSVNLMKSELLRTGAVYTELSHVRLSEATA